jgi:hypothetical protein
MVGVVVFVVVVTEKLQKLLVYTSTTSNELSQLANSIDIGIVRERGLADESFNRKN